MTEPQRLALRKLHEHRGGGVVPAAVKRRTYDVLVAEGLAQRIGDAYYQLNPGENVYQLLVADGWVGE
jgi:hypothetical protein